MRTLRLPDLQWLIDENILPIPIMPTTGDVVTTDDIEEWVRWAYECGLKKSDVLDMKNGNIALVGITKRELFAAFALQGFVARGYVSDKCADAVKIADELISCLKKDCVK